MSKIIDDYLSDKDKEQSLRQEVSEVLRAYRHPWDVFAELLQNSVDAINTRFSISNDPNYYRYNEYRERFIDFDDEECDENFRGKINISWDLQSNKVCISDNGVGIEDIDVSKFLLPKGSGKVVGKDYGFKGLGLTFVAFASKELQLSSKHVSSESATNIEVDGLFDWLVGDKDFPEHFITNSGQKIGTSICVTLDSCYEESFDAISALDNMRDLVKSKEDCIRFEYTLRTRTALGNTKLLFKRGPKVPIDIEYKIKLDSGEVIENGLDYKYYHPVEHKELSILHFDFEAYNENLGSATKDKSFRALTHSIEDVEIGRFKSKKFPIDIYLCAASQTRLRNIERDIGVDNDFGMAPGIHLAINGMPTGILLDDWRDKSATFKRYYVMVDADLTISQTLDPGRKGISGHYARLISQKVVELISESRVGSNDSFARFSTTCLDTGRKSDDNGYAEDLNLEGMHDRFNELEESYTTEELSLLKKLQFFSGFKKLPDAENEVIALFFELIGRGYIKSYAPKMVSSRATYDAIFDLKMDLTKDNLYPSDPLGVGQVQLDRASARGRDKVLRLPRSKRDGFCVEFKTNIGNFVSEIAGGKTDKDPSSIDILICWGKSVNSSLDMYSLNRVVGEQRAYHSITHSLGVVGLGGHNADIYCIVLKDVIESLYESLS